LGCKTKETEENPGPSHTFPCFWVFPGKRVGRPRFLPGILTCRLGKSLAVYSQFLIAGLRGQIHRQSNIKTRFISLRCMRGADRRGGRVDVDQVNADEFVLSAPFIDALSSRPQAKRLRNCIGPTLD